MKLKERVKIKSFFLEKCMEFLLRLKKYLKMICRPYFTQMNDINAGFII